MTVHRYRYCHEAKGMIPIDEWNGKYGTNLKVKAHYVIGELPPYVAVTGDMQGKVVDGRKAHKAFLRRNKLVEVGDEQSYMTRNGGMTDDNPNLKSDKQYEDEVCRSLMTNLERLKRQ